MKNLFQTNYTQALNAYTNTKEKINAEMEQHKHLLITSPRSMEYRKIEQSIMDTYSLSTLGYTLILAEEALLEWFFVAMKKQKLDTISEAHKNIVFDSIKESIDKNPINKPQFIELALNLVV